MKKLISISVALALLVTFMVPAVVTAQDPPDWAGAVPDDIYDGELGAIQNPGAYSKTPFGIFGAGLQLIGYLVADADGLVEGLGVDLPFDLADIVPIPLRLGAFVAGPVAWMTDMTAWFMIVLGDVISAAGGLVEGMGVELPFDLAEVADLFYVVSARLFDEWGIYPEHAPGDHGRP